MVFSSLTFIFLFLPITLLLYFIIPKRFIKVKNIILLICSLIFYAWGEPKYISLMLLSIFVSWIFGLLIEHFKDKKTLKRIIFSISIVTILSSLLYFKYTNFFIRNLNIILKNDISLKNIALPIGISFYTFQILSYIIDLYRGKIKVQKNFFNLALYISFFPQLIAGPIVRYETIEKQLLKRNITLANVVNGLERFIIGLSKKTIIANYMAIICDTIFNSNQLTEYNSLVLLLGIVTYTFQIYFDFSGYSDMAIGLGKIFGFEFQENFNYPYMAKSITDFWRRWHISLTTFFREYIYIPLGGNRVSKKRWIINILIIWLLTGFWHGASWTFIAWGLYYFVILILERTVLKNIITKIPKTIMHIVTIVIVMIGWTLFRATSLKWFLLIMGNLFSNKGSIGIIDFFKTNIDIMPAIPFIIVAIIFSSNIYQIINNRYHSNMVYIILKRMFLILLFIVCIMFLVSSKYNPFIYFRF